MILKCILFAALFWRSSLLSAVADPSTKISNTGIVLTNGANRLEIVIQNLPGIEKLWPQQPGAYFKSLQDAVGFMEGSINDPRAPQALLVTWTNVFQEKTTSG